MVKSLYEFIVNKVHDKVNKDDIYFIWIMKKFIRDLHDNYCFPQISVWPNECFWMFILTKEENNLFKKTKFSNVFLNHFKNKAWEKNCIIFEYTLNDKYTLYIYWSWKRKHKIIKVMKANLWTLQLLFRDDNLKIFQQKLVDIFWLYWSFTTFQMLLHYLSGEVFNIKEIFWPWSVQKDLWKYWWDITIDISILEKTIKEWKEKFQDKLDLLYLLLGNIIKVCIRHFQFFLFFNFIEEWKKEFNITNKDIKNQDIDWEFKTYTMKLQYLYSYLFKEFFDDYIYKWSKRTFAFYSFEKKEEVKREEIKRRKESLSDSCDDEDDDFDDFDDFDEENVSKEKVNWTNYLKFDFKKKDNDWDNELDDNEIEDNEESIDFENNEESNDNDHTWDDSEEDDFDDDEDFGNYDDDDDYDDDDYEEEEESLFGDYELVIDWWKYIKSYNNFDLESLKKVALIIDQKLSEKYQK